MVIIYHKNNKVVEVNCDDEIIRFSQKNVAKTLIATAALFSDKLMVWCHYDVKSNLDFSHLDRIFHHNKILASYNLGKNLFLNEAIGYVDESPYIKINENVIYPTWQTSSYVGGIHASVLLKLKDELHTDNNFDYFLHSLSKLAMPLGLLCYSEPLLVKDTSNKFENVKGNKLDLFKFVKQHYKTRWVFLLFLNLVLFEKQTPFIALFFSLFYRKRKLCFNLLKEINVKSSNKTISLGSIDVIIPTIGRREYLYDVLKDLSIQTHLPKNIIIVEQNPTFDSVSELEYINEENWPFKIKHTFTHQAGACNARNIALSKVESEWVFMADDDIRIEQYFIESSIEIINTYGVNAITFSCLRKNDRLIYNNFFQWPTFGSGCSIVKFNQIKNIKFDFKYEFGFGEDADFGIKLRNQGIDILYSPNPKIEHIKAPIGGFRTKPVLAWSNDAIQPKPSPTIMLYKKLHLSKQQQNGYRIILFFKFYKVQHIKNPILYFINFNKQWQRSLYWANKLKSKK